MSQSFPSVQACFGAFFGKKSFFPLFHRGSRLRKISKKSKKFQSSKMPLMVSQSVPTSFEQPLGRCFWFCLPNVPCRAFQIIWTWNKEFRFPKLKIRVDFADKTHNRHSFCIHATVNIRNSISDVLDLKLWVQIPELKNMSSVFRTWKTWVQFSGLNFWGRDIEKIKEKNQKSFKVPKMSQIVPRCPNVIWGNFFENVFLPSVQWSHWKFSKKSKKFQNCRNAQNRCQNCPNLFWTCFEAIFPNFFARCSMQGFSDFLDLKIWGQFSGLKKFEFGFWDLKFEVDTQKKLKKKVKKISKF